MCYPYDSDVDLEEEEDNDMDMDGVKADEVALASVAAEAVGKDSNDIADALKELDMDHYDDDNDGIPWFFCLKCRMLPISL